MEIRNAFVNTFEKKWRRGVDRGMSKDGFHNWKIFWVLYESEQKLPPQQIVDIWHILILSTVPGPDLHLWKMGSEEYWNTNHAKRGVSKAFFKLIFLDRNYF